MDIVAKYLFAEDGIWFSNITYIPAKVACEYGVTFLLRCNFRELKHEISMLQLMYDRAIIFLIASFLRSLFKLFTFLFVPS